MEGIVFVFVVACVGWYVTQNELNNTFEEYVMIFERATEAERLSTLWET